MEHEKINFPSPALWMNFKELPLQANTKLRRSHYHGELELVFVDFGRVLCKIEGESVALLPGQLLVINRMAVHQIMHDGVDCTVRYCQINADRHIERHFPAAGDLWALPMCYEGAKSYMLFGGGHPAVDITRRLISEYLRREEYFELAADHETGLLINALCRSGMFGRRKPDDARGLAELREVFNFVERNYKQKITLSDICSIVSCEKTGFCKKFKSVTGVTFIEYVNFVRLRSAERLLIETDMSVADIALECGFASVQYFNRFFKGQKGYTPGIYRKKRLM